MPGEAHRLLAATRARETRADNRRRHKRGLPPRKLVKPSVWIISAGSPSALRAQLAFQKAPEGPDGVYHFFFDVLRVGLIVAPELPRAPSTLLVRLMAAGPLLPEAIRELGKLPPTAPERVVAEGILVRFQRFLRKKPNRSPQEQEFIKAMYKTWEDARAEGIAKGITKGRAEGSTTTQAKAVLTVLARGRQAGWHRTREIRIAKDLDRVGPVSGDCATLAAYGSDELHATTDR